MDTLFSRALVLVKRQNASPSSEAPGNPSASGLSKGNVILIAITSAIVGLMVIAFVIYMIYRVRKGHRISDLLQPHHEVEAPMPSDYLDKDTTNMIVCSQRFSVRSTRYFSRPGSMRSTFSKRTYGNGTSSRSAYQQFNNAYMVKPYTAPQPRPRTAVPPLPTLTTDMRPSSTISRPSLAHLDSKSPLSADTLSPESHGIAEEVVLNKLDAKHLTVTTRPVSHRHSRTNSPKIEPSSESISWKNSKSRGPVPKHQSTNKPPVPEPTELPTDRPSSRQSGPTLMQSIAEGEALGVSTTREAKLPSHQSTFLLPLTPTSPTPSLRSVVRKWTRSDVSSLSPSEMERGL